MLNQSKRKREGDGGPRDEEVAQFSVGDNDLLTCPSRPPNKLARIYRDSMIITVMDRPDLIKVKDLITNRES